jgi:spore germination protein GerM
VTGRIVRLLAAAIVAVLAACGGGQGTPEQTKAPQPGQAAEVAPNPGEALLSKSSVTLYFPSASGDTLVQETREIVDTKRPSDRGTQILAALLEGPQQPGALPAVPEGTTLRNLWVRDDGNAYADFSEELLGAADHGSADEILTVYAIIDSLTANVPTIRRVGILVAGKERESFGHLDLSRPLPPNLTLAPSTKAPE